MLLYVAEFPFHYEENADIFEAAIK